MKKNKLVIDTLIILISILFSILIVKTGFLETFLNAQEGYTLFESFISGMFFTTVFTTAPAIASLGTIAQHDSALLISFFGALGALSVDLFLFKFMKDRFSEDLLAFFKHRKKSKMLKVITHKIKSYRWITFFVAGFIIASPLPDELAVTMLGFTHTRVAFFIPFSLIFNFLGIYVICITAQAIA